MEGDNDPRSRGLPRPRAHAGVDPAEAVGFGICRLPQGEIVPDDLPEMGEHEVQIPKPRVLVPGVLRGHGGEEHGEDRRVHPTPARRRQVGRPADDRLRGGPVQRVALDRMRALVRSAAAFSGSW